MFKRSSAFAFFLLALSCATSACDDSSGPSREGLTILRGSGLSDTIQAELVQALVVQIRDDEGLIARDVTVRFHSVPVGEPPTPGVLVSAVDAQGFGTFHADTTNPQGEALARIKMGTLTGEAILAIEVPEFGLVGTAQYTVLPGAAHTVAVEPRDSAAYVTSTYTLRGGSVDRFGNVRSDPVVYASLTQNVASVSASGVVRGLQIGRGRLTAASGGATDTLHVSVVPEGVLAARHTSRFSTEGLVAFELDGAGFHEATRMEPQGIYMSPDWSPAGDELIMYTLVGGGARLFIADASASTTRLIQNASALQWESWPEFGPLGNWVYFSGAAPGEQQAVWRVGADGTQLERVSPPAGHTVAMLSVEPDGSRVAYTVEQGGWQLYLVDVASGAVDTLNVSGYSPRWSPNGSQIAFVQDRQVKVMAPDGSDIQVVSPQQNFYDIGLDWSPDGEWIAATLEGGGIHLIQVASGLALPLGYTEELYEPSWQR